MDGKEGIEVFCNAEEVDNHGSYIYIVTVVSIKEPGYYCTDFPDLFYLSQTLLLAKQTF